MSLKEWLRRKTAMLALTFSNVEKDVFSQSSEGLEVNVSQSQRHTQGQLADSLINGEMTQEVMNLRWRTYKVLREVDKYSSKIIGVDKQGVPIVETKKVDRLANLSKIKLEPSDEYLLEFSVNNDNITTSIADAISNQYDTIDRTISLSDYLVNFKSEKPIFVGRKIHPKFNIEKYTHKLHVRKITDDERLLEFYISKYPDPERKTSGLFVNYFIKEMETPTLSSLFEINEVSFTSYKTLGVEDFKYFNYEILSLDKIVEFNGSYVVKFRGKVIVNGEDILEKYRQVELDEKYKNKEKK